LTDLFLGPARRNMLSEFKSFLLFDRGVERVTFSHRARSVFTVTLDFHFLCIIGVGTVVAAIGF
jgi:hypothetical protein